MLKPVNEEDVIRLLSHIADDLQFCDKLEIRMQMGIAAFKDQIFNFWVQGRNEQVTEHLRMLNIEMEEHDSYCCILVELDFHEHADTQMADEDVETTRFAVRNIMKEILDDHGVLFEISRERYGILMYSDPALLNFKRFVRIRD
ncbi:hypothetical protein [Paenibacillus dokdonensis]|uniref:hypothetical protein n=1 Tax=Paenibacillus dokdonensis TaxID=2567944 RepID=UPI001457ACE2|nr:hypothetical protein [Paenibacillus dokdonensis]